MIRESCQAGHYREDGEVLGESLWNRRGMERTVGGQKENAITGTEKVEVVSILNFAEGVRKLRFYKGTLDFAQF